MIEGIRALRDAEVEEVMFYPFILMEQLADNGLADPWTGAADQPVLPWRGRITLDRAPGREGSSDGTHAAVSEVRHFPGLPSPAISSLRMALSATRGLMNGGIDASSCTMPISARWQEASRRSASGRNWSR